MSAARRVSRPSDKMSRGWALRWCFLGTVIPFGIHHARAHVLSRVLSEGSQLANEPRRLRFPVSSRTACSAQETANCTQGSNRRRLHLNCRWLLFQNSCAKVNRNSQFPPAAKAQFGNSPQRESE